MVNKAISLVDYGVGNLLSVRRALEACGATVAIVKNPEELTNSGRLVLPGVGAFGNCIDELRKRNLEESILEFIKAGKPLLGICVGMQILQQTGEEFGLHKGLGVIPGKVTKIQDADQHGTRKVPFVGWAKLKQSVHSSSSIFEGLDRESFFYLVHSFKAEPDNSKHIIASYHYNGLDITALVNKMYMDANSIQKKVVELVFYS